MKKNFFIRLLFLFVIQLNAQENNNQFQVVDILTKTPLERVNIVIKGTTFGTISNEEGMFQLEDQKPETAIQFSHVGYKTYTAPFKEFKTTNIVYLEPFTTDLEEIIVLNEPIEKTLATLIATSSAQLNKPLVLNTYYREFVSVNDKYTKFSDGLLNYKILGTSKKMKTESQVLQSRAANLIGEDEETLNIAAVNDIRNTIEKQCSFTYLAKNFATKDFSEKYDYNLKSIPNKNGKELFKIEITPKPEVEELLSNGYIIYDPATKLISEVAIQSAESHLKYPKTINILILKLALLNFKILQSFKVVNGKYVLSNAGSEGKFKIWNKRKFNDFIGFKYDILVTNFTENLTTFNEKKSNNEKALFKYGNNYTTPFWKQENAIVLTEKEQQIIKKLEEEVANK